MKEEKCFVLAINNNEIHPVDMPRERYDSAFFSFLPDLFSFVSAALFAWHLPYRKTIAWRSGKRDQASQILRRRKFLCREIHFGEPARLIAFLSLIPNVVTLLVLHSMAFLMLSIP